MWRIDESVGAGENSMQEAQRMRKTGQPRRKDGLSVRPASRPLGDVTNKAAADKAAAARPENAAADKAAAARSENVPSQQAASRPRSKLGDITNKALPPVESLSIGETTKPPSFDRSGLDPDGCAAAALSLIAPCFATPRWLKEGETLLSPQLLRTSVSFVPLSPKLPAAAAVEDPEGALPECLPQMSATLPAFDEFRLPPAASLCVPTEEKIPEELFAHVRSCIDSDEDVDMELDD
jgi:hypothetical protein